jgi:uncharacterized RDD family membrane protein YckC
MLASYIGCFWLVTQSDVRQLKLKDMIMEFSADRDDNSNNENKHLDITFEGKPSYESSLGKHKFPGCFKKSIAFLIDNIIIVIIGIALLFPFSTAIGSLYQHAWIPSYLIGTIYFMIFDSSISNHQTIGKRMFSLKVITTENESISIFAAIGRYVLLTIPLYNGMISGSIASTVGITNTTIGGIIFFIIVGVLLSGNTLFMLLHPQKRGLHDVLFRTVVVSNDYEESTKVQSFCIKPIIGGVIGFAIFAISFGSLFYNVGNNPDFKDINELTERLKKESDIKNINAAYKTFSMNGKQTTFAIEVIVPVPYDKFDDKNFTDELSNKLYPLVKRININPKVNTITMVFHAQKYIGAFPISKTSGFPKKLSEIN